MRVNDEEALIDALSALAVEMSAELQRRFGREPVVVPTVSSSGVRKSSWWIPALGGAVVAGAGAVCLGSSMGDYARLDPEQPPSTLDPTQVNDTVARGKALQTTAIVLFAVGAAAAVGAAGIAAFGTETRVIAIRDS